VAYVRDLIKQGFVGVSTCTNSKRVWATQNELIP